jgi:hypothetical protein
MSEEQPEIKTEQSKKTVNDELNKDYKEIIDLIDNKLNKNKEAILKLKTIYNRNKKLLKQNLKNKS